MAKVRDLDSRHNLAAGIAVDIEKNIPPPFGAAPYEFAPEYHSEVCDIDIEDWTVGEAYAGAPPEPDPVVAGVFMNKTTGIYAAIGGAGKTDVHIELALTIAKNEQGEARWLGYPIKVFGSVVMLCAEDNQGSVHQRIVKLNPGFDASPYKDQVCIVPIPNISGNATLIDRDGEPTDLLRRLGDQIDRRGDVRLFVPDPLRHFCRADINSDPDMATQVLNHFNAFATRHNLLALLPHHLSKRGVNATSSIEAREAIQGVSAIVDHARAAFVMWMIAKPRGEDILHQLAMKDPTHPEWRVFYGALVKANHPFPDYSTRTLVRTDQDRLLDFTAKLEGEHVEELTADQYDSHMADLLAHITQAAKEKRPYVNSNREPCGILHKDNLDKLKNTSGKRIGTAKDIKKLIDALAFRELIHFANWSGSKVIVPGKAKT